MRVRNEEQYEKKKTELMEQCYQCFAENGLSGVGIRMLAKHCGCTISLFYTYFRDMDDLIVQATEHCMSKVEDDFMARAPKNAAELEHFINELPQWTAKEHGKKYRLMYQVYTHPKYREYGQAFFQGVDRRYAAYAKLLESQIGIPADILRPMIFVLIRACVHYALFEDEVYLQDQLKLLKLTIRMFRAQYTAAPERGEEGTLKTE